MNYASNFEANPVGNARKGPRKAADLLRLTCCYFCTNHELTELIASKLQLCISHGLPIIVSFEEKPLFSGRNEYGVWVRALMQGQTSLFLSDKKLS